MAIMMSDSLLILLLVGYFGIPAMFFCIVTLEQLEIGQTNLYKVLAVLFFPTFAFSYVLCRLLSGNSSFSQKLSDWLLKKADS
ncbi:hypothetical protein C5F63_10055 [Photobacterium damselae subsp. damselae]|uniref:Uncharacterized protein n=4 Tax=Photobacterium damselae TaxID=38293 RepID=A0A2S2CDP0_PHODM|nr:hypothetical protein BST98_11000 [Photobacterium damselae]PSB77969.1 hypothetical protein C5F61_09425 [Photobacterium damselae subsp. damselae]PSB82609.1 hypothetical protein C5F62_10100 [Photobacterium damselae subsp. damselae]PSB87620.1 hypothetical protein C5F63_10055 [Photobacterium damselae subsp. damselae]TGZ36325.1 hypothetical protein EQ875_00102 [Photobacterium damselae subsp. damselae]